MYCIVGIFQIYFYIRPNSMIVVHSYYCCGLAIHFLQYNMLGLGLYIILLCYYIMLLLVLQNLSRIKYYTKFNNRQRNYRLLVKITLYSYIRILILYCNTSWISTTVDKKKIIIISTRRKESFNKFNRKKIKILNQPISQKTRLL